MTNYTKGILLACLVLINKFVLAQPKASEAMNTNGFMRSEAKIYVVMAVVITILAGVLFYLVRLDTKLSKLEKKENL